LNLPLPAGNTATGIDTSTLSFKGFFIHIIPQSIFEALTKNDILPIVVFAIFFGIATASIGEQGKIVIKALDAVANIILRVTGYVMYLAPLAALAAIAGIVAVKGPELLVTYGKFI